MTDRVLASGSQLPHSGDLRSAASAREQRRAERDAGDEQNRAEHFVEEQGILLQQRRARLEERLDFRGIGEVEGQLTVVLIGALGIHHNGAEDD